MRWLFSCDKLLAFASLFENVISRVRVCVCLLQVTAWTYSGVETKALVYVSKPHRRISGGVPPLRYEHRAAACATSLRFSTNGLGP